jgi:hypothetical protein
MSSPQAASPTAAAAAAEATAAVVQKNVATRSQYRSKRCPRWRLRQDPAARRGRPKTLLYDGSGPPFEKAVETRDAIVVWTRASPGLPVKAGGWQHLSPPTFTLQSNQNTLN